MPQRCAGHAPRMARRVKWVPRTHVARPLTACGRRGEMDIFRVQELYAPVPEFVGEEEGDEKTPKDVAFVVRCALLLLSARAVVLGLPHGLVTTSSALASL